MTSSPTRSVRPLSWGLRPASVRSRRRGCSWATGYLDRAKSEGVRVATGGGAIGGPRYFVVPTVLVDVPEGAEAAREEIFGP
ncbi:aldehyde dehydrogenase family protein [Streptomyces sp. NPDC002920]